MVVPYFGRGIVASLGGADTLWHRVALFWGDKG